MTPFYINEGGNLTINDSSEAKTGLLESLSSSNGETIYFKGGSSSLTVNDGTIKSPGKAIGSGDKVKASYTITINGGKIWSTGSSAISLNANAPVNFRMIGGTIESTSKYNDYAIYTGTYGSGTHTFTFMGGNVKCSAYWYDLYISSGSGVKTVVNIASGMVVRCNTGNGITVNNNYAE